MAGRFKSGDRRKPVGRAISGGRASGGGLDWRSG